MENLYQKMNSKLYQRHKTDNILQKPNKLQLQYHRARFNSHDLQKRKKHKLINIYKQRKKHIKQLEQISQGLQEQKELLKPGKKKKIGNGVYKYFMERKK